MLEAGGQLGSVVLIYCCVFVSSALSVLLRSPQRYPSARPALHFQKLVVFLCQPLRQGHQGMNDWHTGGLYVHSQTDCQTWAESLPASIWQAEWTSTCWVIWQSVGQDNGLIFSVSGFIFSHSLPLTMCNHVPGTGRLTEPLTWTSYGIFLFDAVHCSCSLISLKPNLSWHLSDNKLLIRPSIPHILTETKHVSCPRTDSLQGFFLRVLHCL